MMGKALPRLALGFLGLLLTLYAALGPFLLFLGNQTFGEITEIRRQGGDRAEVFRDRYRWGVGYHFFLPDGTRVDGATTVIGTSFSAGIAKGPAQIVYLRQLPALNQLAVQAHFSLHSVILLGAGVILLRLSFKTAAKSLTGKKR